MFGKLNNETVGTHSKDDFRKLLESQGYLCFYCGIPIVKKSRDPQCEATEDHLVPLSRGGVDFIWNIVAACFACNQLKSGKLPGEFLRERWSIAQLVDPRVQKSTRIPFSKGRVFPPIAEDEFDDDGNLVTSHLEVDPFTGSIVRAMAHAKRMETHAKRMENSDRERRQELLRQQVNAILRTQLEAAGQMTLPFDEPKPVVHALLADEAATLLIRKGLAIASALRRQA